MNLQSKRQKAKYQAPVNELDIEEYKFPLSKNGTRSAVYPTRLGNIITEYEQYPDCKYAMDGVFYWHRIWLSLSSDLRTEIDERQAVVDGAVYVSFVFYIVGVLFLMYSVIQKIFGILFWSPLSPADLVVIAIASLSSGYIIYRISLQAHWQFGNYIKAMFDCFYTKYDPKHPPSSGQERGGPGRAPARADQQPS